MKDNNFLKVLVIAIDNDISGTDQLLKDFGHLFKMLATNEMDESGSYELMDMIANKHGAFKQTKILTYLAKNLIEVSDPIYYNILFELECVYLNLRAGASVQSTEKTLLAEYGESSSFYISYFMGDTIDDDNSFDTQADDERYASKAPYGKDAMVKADAEAKKKDVPAVTFADVAGIDAVKAELMEVVDFLKNPDKYSKLGAKIPKGVLLTGPSGVGKTLLAKAVAGEAGVAFMHKGGSDFETGLSGGGAKSVREMFEEARSYGTCILFIDEIDALARKRGADALNSHGDEKTNQLLVEMDGYGTEADNIIVIGATNLKSKLDPAVLRAGRFSRVIEVGLPDINGREAILGVHSKNKPLNADVDLRKIAEKTTGMSGADLANLMNESAIMGARRDADTITMEDIEIASEKITMGLPKEKVITQEEKVLVAVHETAHAIAMWLLPTDSKLHSLTIQPRGGALGYARSVKSVEKGYKTKKEFIDDIKVSLAGVVGEELFIGEVTSGCSSDLRHANSIATAMITKFGMNGSLVVAEKASPKKVDTFLKNCYDDVKRMLENHKTEFLAIVKLLLKKETLYANELEGIMNTPQTEKSTYSDKINAVLELLK